MTIKNLFHRNTANPGGEIKVSDPRYIDLPPYNTSGWTIVSFILSFPACCWGAYWLINKMLSEVAASFEPHTKDLTEHGFLQFLLTILTIAAIGAISVFYVHFGIVWGEEDKVQLFHNPLVGWKKNPADVTSTYPSATIRPYTDGIHLKPFWANLVKEVSIKGEILTTVTETCETEDGQYVVVSAAIEGKLPSGKFSGWASQRLIWEDDKRREKFTNKLRAFMNAVVKAHKYEWLVTNAFGNPKSEFHKIFVEQFLDGPGMLDPLELDTAFIVSEGCRVTDIKESTVTRRAKEASLRAKEAATLKLKLQEFDPKMSDWNATLMAYQLLEDRPGAHSGIGEIIPEIAIMQRMMGGGGNNNNSAQQGGGQRQRKKKGGP